MDPGNAATGFTERDRDKISGLARATELGLVIRGLEFSGVDFQLLPMSVVNFACALIRSTRACRRVSIPGRTGVGALAPAGRST